VLLRGWRDASRLIKWPEGLDDGGAMTIGSLSATSAIFIFTCDF
jgi:hypothetical protein